MFNIKSFEVEYYTFIIDLKIKSYGKNYNGYLEDLRKLEALKNKTNGIKKENSKNYQKILELKNNIREGRVIKVMTSNGNYVWKKVK